MRRLTETYWGRLATWRMPTVRDDRFFPTAKLAPSATPVKLPLQSTTFTADFGELQIGGRSIAPSSLDAFLERHDTTAFLVLREGQIVSERYFRWASADTPLAAFSLSKSIVSALIGIALERRILGAISDPVTAYVPELSEACRTPVTLEHLLTMTSGLRYRRGALPWGEDARYYYAPDRWATVLAHARFVDDPGAVWNYNDFSPTILATILSRATGQTLAQLSQQALLAPLGMPHPAHWILDSDHCRIENAAAGLYASARTLAAFGQLYLDRGQANGRQIFSGHWALTSTSMNDHDSPALHNVKFQAFDIDRLSYKYFWWVWERPDAISDYIAIGNFGQFIYVSPSTRTVIVRTGTSWRKFGPTNWLNLLRALTHENAERATTTSL